MIKSADEKLRKITNRELAYILETHEHWVLQNCDDWQVMRMDLSYTDLSNMNLQNANLYNANLEHANLKGAILENADLSYANLRCANLEGAKMHRTILHHANLHQANLSHADLTNGILDMADLSFAYLQYTKLDRSLLHKANLHDADLSYADLTFAELNCANLNRSVLRGTNLETADIDGSNLSYVCGLEQETFRTGKILTENMIGYKKCQDDIIVTLEIPRGAIVFSINGNKCRTNKAKVIAIDGANRAYSAHSGITYHVYYGGADGANRAYSSYNGISYYVGDEFTVYNFDCQYNIECGKGIHFFMTREEAENY